ncbi:MAG: hypothetical protein Q3M30_08025 [Candidatus Electrothrix sp. Rat3]|nr:hypothetical protein [Candidatus Electrothrix rattekaaiensis]
MKWTSVYLIGYIILIGGIVAALRKLGVISSIGIGWTVIGMVILIGIGVMLAVSQSGSKRNITIDKE